MRYTHVLVALLVGGAVLHVHARAPQAMPLLAPQAMPLLDKSALVYEGAFRLPDATVNGTSFHYGGTALGFNSNRRSLFLVGHDWHQRVAEISIPQPRRSAVVDQLSTATLLQPFADVTEGRLPLVDQGTVKIGGMLVSGDRLYVSAYSYYDGDANQRLSHFVSGLDLGVQGDVQGPIQVWEKAGLVSGYMADVPDQWQALLGGPVLIGQCCLAIISRTSYGPAAFAVDLSRLGRSEPIAPLPLVYYPSAHPLGQWGTQNAYVNGSTSIRGLVFPARTRSILFFGRHGIGPFCYGSGVECHDPADPSQGTHAYPYEYYVWAYDASNLLAVRDGTKQPWEVRPYATWILDMPFKPSSGAAVINGAAYDSTSGRVFVSQAYGDRSLPVIHVFRLQS